MILLLLDVGGVCNAKNQNLSGLSEKYTRNNAKKERNQILK